MARALFILLLILVVAVAPLPGRIRVAGALFLALLAGVVFYLSVEQEAEHAVEQAEAERMESERWTDGDGAARFTRTAFGTPLFFGDHATVSFAGEVLGPGPRQPTGLAVAVTALDCPDAAVSEGCTAAGESTATVGLAVGLPDAPRSFTARLRFDGLDRPQGVYRFEPRITRVRY